MLDCGASCPKLDLYTFLSSLAVLLSSVLGFFGFQFSVHLFPFTSD